MDHTNYRRMKAKVEGYERLSSLLDEVNAALQILKKGTSGDFSKIRPITKITIERIGKEDLVLEFPKTAADQHTFWIADNFTAQRIIESLEDAKRYIVADLTAIEPRG